MNASQQAVMYILTFVYYRARVGSGATRLKATPIEGSNIQRPWATLGPVRDPTIPAMACNTPGTPVRFSADARPGSQVTAYWNRWPHNGGPVSVWMVECPGDCSSFTSPHTASWFKIYEDGLEGAKKLINKGNSVTVTIPSSLKPGNYLLRHQLIVSDTKKYNK